VIIYKDFIGKVLNGNFRAKNHCFKLERLWKNIVISLITMKIAGPIPYFHLISISISPGHRRMPDSYAQYLEIPLSPVLEVSRDERVLKIKK